MSAALLATWARSREGKTAGALAGTALVLLGLMYWNAARVAARAPSAAQAAAVEACEEVRWPKGGKVTTINGAVNTSRVALCFKQDLFCTAAIDACRQHRQASLERAVRELRNGSPR